MRKRTGALFRGAAPVRAYKRCLKMYIYIYIFIFFERCSDYPMEAISGLLSEICHVTQPTSSIGELGPIGDRIWSQREKRR
jgi:hypothetical protein